MPIPNPEPPTIPITLTLILNMTLTLHFLTLTLTLFRANPDPKDCGLAKELGYIQQEALRARVGGRVEIRVRVTVTGCVGGLGLRPWPL